MNLESRISYLNSADWGRPWLNRLARLNRWFCRRVHRLRGGPIPLPESGPALVVANHISGLDPLLLIAASPRPLRFLIAREEYERFGLQWLFRAVGCIPVDRAGRPEQALRAAIRALQAGEVVALFPEGRIHADDAPRRLKPGVWKLAQIGDCPVHPVHIDGVRGRGRILGALLLRSRARLTVHDPTPCGRLPMHDCLDALAGLIAGREKLSTQRRKDAKGAKAKL